MKKLLLFFLLLLAIHNSYSQAKSSIRNVADIKGAVVKQEKGDYTDPQSKRSIGHYAIIYIIDTIRHQLLNVSITSKDRRGERIYLYYYELNRLSQASSGIVDNGNTIIQNNYTYDEEDNRMTDRDLQVFSETDEKYALLKESKKYVTGIKKL